MADTTSKQDTPELPASIKAQFHSFETIGPANNKYIADPVFIGFPDDHLCGVLFTVSYTAEEDGSKWLVRSYSPTNRQFKKRGTYDVCYCRLTQESS